MSFKENLKSELEYQGMLIKELAFKAGVNKRSIENYLGVRDSIPSAEVAVSIGRALGVSVEYLVTGQDAQFDGLSCSFSPKTRTLLRISSQLKDKDLDIILNLAKVLIDREKK
jgi:transcriptional regulator with XRE-family HTH domain